MADLMSQLLKKPSFTLFATMIWVASFSLTNLNRNGSIDLFKTSAASIEKPYKAYCLLEPWYCEKMRSVFVQSSVHPSSWNLEIGLQKAINCNFLG